MALYRAKAPKPKRGKPAVQSSTRRALAHLWLLRARRTLMSRAANGSSSNWLFPNHVKSPDCRQGKAKGHGICRKDAHSERARHAYQEDAHSNTAHGALDLRDKHHEQGRVAQGGNQKRPRHKPAVGPNCPFTDRVPGRIQVRPEKDQCD